MNFTFGKKNYVWQQQLSKTSWSGLLSKVLFIHRFLQIMDHKLKSRDFYWSKFTVNTVKCPSERYRHQSQKKIMVLTPAFTELIDSQTFTHRLFIIRLSLKPQFVKSFELKG